MPPIVRCVHKGGFLKTNRFLHKLLKNDYLSIMDRYGKEGVKALSDATPKDTGKTAESWDYKIEEDHKGVHLIFTNSNVNEGVNIAIILQYGHGKRNGGYVPGIDYINPAIRPIFEEMVKKITKEVTAK